MKNKIMFLALVAVTALVVFGIAGCGGGNQFADTSWKSEDGSTLSFTKDTYTYTPSGGTALTGSYTIRPRADNEADLAITSGSMGAYINGKTLTLKKVGGDVEFTLQ